MKYFSVKTMAGAGHCLSASMLFVLFFTTHNVGANPERTVDTKPLVDLLPKTTQPDVALDVREDLGSSSNRTISLQIIENSTESNQGVKSTSRSNTINERKVHPSCWTCDCKLIGGTNGRTPEVPGYMHANCSFKSLNTFPLDDLKSYDGDVFLDLSGNPGLFSEQGELKGLCDLGQRAVKGLNLSSNKLENIPPALKGCFGKLESLDLTGNHLNDLEESQLGQFHNLRELRGLRIRGNLAIDTLHPLKSLRILEVKLNAITLPNGLFYELNDLEDLTLELTGANSLPPHMFSKHQKSAATKLRHLNLIGPKIKRRFPRRMWDDLGSLESLQLELPRLRRLQRPTIYKLDKLVRLTLRGMNGLDQDFLPGLDHLVQLDIRGVPTMGYLKLPTLPVLKSLRIESGRVQKLDPMWREMFPALEELDLRDNEITSIDVNIHTVANVRRLVLADNRISIISHGAFTPLDGIECRLTSIDLSNNMLDTLGEAAFSKLSHLEQLHLSENSLSSMKGSLRKLTSLRLLDLKANYISTLDPSLFTEAPNLKVLILSDNSFKDTPASLQSSSLESLDLSMNSVDKVNGKLFCDVNTLTRLRLEGLHIACTCSVKDLADCRDRLIVSGVCTDESGNELVKISDLSSCHQPTTANNTPRPIATSTASTPITTTTTTDATTTTPIITTTRATSTKPAETVTGATKAKKIMETKEYSSRKENPILTNSKTEALNVVVKSSGKKKKQPKVTASPNAVSHGRDQIKPVSPPPPSSTQLTSKPPTNTPDEDNSTAGPETEDLARKALQNPGKQMFDKGEVSEKIPVEAWLAMASGFIMIMFVVVLLIAVIRKRKMKRNSGVRDAGHNRLELQGMSTEPESYKTIEDEDQDTVRATINSSSSEGDQHLSVKSEKAEVPEAESCDIQMEEVSV